MQSKMQFTDTYVYIYTMTLHPALRRRRQV